VPQFNWTQKRLIAKRRPDLSVFSAAEIVDLILTTGWYHLCAVILGTLRVELEGQDR
jgi:alkylhydroperoxidase family enzyme